MRVSYGLTAEIIAKVHRLAARGHTKNEIAAQVGICFNAVQYLRKTKNRPAVIDMGDDENDGPIRVMRIGRPPKEKKPKPKPRYVPYRERIAAKPRAPRPPKESEPPPPIVRPQIGAIRELTAIGRKQAPATGSPGNTSMQNAITSHTIERIRDLATTGLTSSEIATATGVLINTVEHVQGRRPENSHGRPQKIADDLIEMIHTLSHQGLPASDIAKQIGISYQTVLRYAKEPPDATRDERRQVVADQIIYHLRVEFPDRWHSIVTLPGRERLALLNEIADAALRHAEDLFTDEPDKYSQDAITEGDRVDTTID